MNDVQLNQPTRLGVTLNGDSELDVGLRQQTETGVEMSGPTRLSIGMNGRTRLGIRLLSGGDNTTYTLTQDAQDGHILTLTGSDGSTSTVTVPDGGAPQTKTTAQWEAAPAYVPTKGEICIYSDHGTTEVGGITVNVPGIKIGDGSTAIGGLPFTGDDVRDTILDGLGALAAKDTASTTYTPAGSISTPTFTGTEVSLSGFVKPSGTVSQPTFTGTAKSVSVTGTPTGTIGTGNGAANYTPSGSISAPTLQSYTVDATGVYVAASASGGGSVAPGTAASCTLPVLSMSVANDTLTISWTAGSFTANTPTSVTLPTFSSQNMATGISNMVFNAPTFTGTGAELKFSGDSMTATGSYTPEGTVSQPTFSGDTSSFGFVFTPTGSISTPTFTGTQATIEVN